MTKMRLTTLNLDQECVDLLGSKANKSAHVRHVLKNHADMAEELRSVEALLIDNRLWYARIIAEIVEAYESGWTVDALLANLLDETPVVVGQYAEGGHLPGAIRAAVNRRVML